MSDTVYRELENDLHALLDSSERPLFFALGNELRGDDHAGILTGEMISDNLRDKVIIAHNVPINFLGKVVKFNPDLIIILDAIDIGAKPGTIALMGPEVLSDNHSSTHFQTLNDFFELIKNQLNREIEIKILGIQIKSKEMFDDISQEVERAVHALVDMIKTYYVLDG